MTDEDCLTMIKSIFSDVYVQSFPQISRYNVYVILLHFLLYRLDGKLIKIFVFNLRDFSFLFKSCSTTWK